MKLWSGQTISAFGSLITGVALPFTAILALKAGALQMALLNSANLLAGLLFGLVAGVWVDRLRRRPILIATDLGRALLLATIPLAAFLHLLRIEQLYVVAFLAGVLTIFFDVAYVAYLPALVRPEQLLEGNSKLSASASAAEVGGFGLGGWLVQRFTGPVAILIDAISFVLSAALVGRIRGREPEPALASEREGVRREIVVGLQRVWHDPLLRALAVSSVLIHLTWGLIGTVILLYVTRELGFSAGVQGVIYAVGGASSLVGAMLAGPAARRIGVGPTLILTLLLSALGSLFLPLAHGATASAATMLVAQQLITDPAMTIYEINQTSLRQAITPDRMLGRVNASIRFLGLITMLVGTLIAGSLGERIGLRATLLLGSGSALLAALLLALSPVRRLKTAPVASSEALGEAHPVKAQNR